MSNEEVYLSNIESELSQIKEILKTILGLLSSMDFSLDEISRKKS